MLTMDLGKVAFYWRMTSEPNVPPNPVPDFLNFEFSFREAEQLIIQTRRRETLECLETVYRENYNVGYLQEGHALAEGYGGDFIAYIENSLKRYLPSARRISEIGAGGCYILKLLKERGYEVAAIDPGPAAIEKGKEFGIEVISGFYPTQRPIQKSDLILHYDLLEHVDDPVAFLRNHAGDINPGGLVLFAVPDCSPYIAFGDISMILHEHLNYFDEESLRNVVEAAGFEVLEICKGGYGGVLYCTARVVKYRNVCDEKNSMLKFSAFIARTQKLQDQINNFISTGISVGHSLGCYVPLRAIPYLSKLQLTEGVRFFDDNSGIHGQYFDGFSIPVENFQDLKDRPVTHLLVLSFAFGDKLRQKINKGIPQHAINICCLSDFIPHEGVPC